MPLEDFYKKIVALQEFDLEKEIIDIINEESDFLEDLLKQQMFLGIDGDGNEKTLKRKGGFFPEYSPFTKKIKEEFGLGVGAVTDRITHSMSGEFWHSIKLHISGNEFYFDSDVSYFQDIIASSGSGKKIMELDKYNLDLFTNNVLIPEIQRRFNLKFNGS